MSKRAVLPFQETAKRPQYGHLSNKSNIIVKGYSSPEGDPVKNQALSEARANAVKTALVNRYKIAADRIEAQGAGATSDISEENDFNRVAMFFTK